MYDSYLGANTPCSFNRFDGRADQLGLELVRPYGFKGIQVGRFATGPGKEGDFIYRSYEFTLCIGWITCF